MTSILFSKCVFKIRGPLALCRTIKLRASIPRIRLSRIKSLDPNCFDIMDRTDLDTASQTAMTGLKTFYVYFIFYYS